MTKKNLFLSNDDLEIEFLATNSNFLIPISLQPDGVNLRYYKLGLFDTAQFIA